MLYRHPSEHQGASLAERAWIEQDPADPVVPLSWSKVASKRETCAYALGKFFVDQAWWFCLLWLPGCLFERYHMDLKTFGLPLAAIYLLSDGGSIAGGWLSSRLPKAGWTPNAVRKTTMLICAFCVVPIYFAQSVDNVWMAALVIGLVKAAHQAFSANLYTLPSDIFPRAAVGSVVGIGDTVGAIGGMFMAKFTGYILDSTGGNDQILFALCASTYFVALLAVHILSPRLARAEV